MDEIKVIERLATVEQDNKAINRRLGNLERMTESVHIIATETRTIATETKAMREDMNDIMNRVTEIEKKPSRRWETVITALITAIVGAAVGYLFRGGI